MWDVSLSSAYAISKYKNEKFFLIQYQKIREEDKTWNFGYLKNQEESNHKQLMIIWLTSISVRWHQSWKYEKFRIFGGCWRISLRKKNFSWAFKGLFLEKYRWGGHAGWINELVWSSSSVWQKTWKDENSKNLRTWKTNISWKLREIRKFAFHNYSTCIHLYRMAPNLKIEKILSFWVKSVGRKLVHFSQSEEIFIRNFFPHKEKAIIFPKPSFDKYSQKATRDFFTDVQIQSTSTNWSKKIFFEILEHDERP